MICNGLDLEQLKAFVAVTDLRSFRRAAEELNLSAPALSRRIERLEDRVGARLLERTSRSVRLSRVGESFVERVRAVLQDLDAAVLDVGELSSGHRGRVTLAAIPSAAIGLVPRALADFTRQLPEVQVRVLDGSLQATQLAVLGGQADLGVGFLDTPVAGLHAETLGVDPYVLAVPAGHRWAARRSLRLPEIARERLLSLASGSGNRQLLDSQLLQLGLTLPPAHEAAHIGALLGLVEAGLGCALVPSMALRLPPPGLRAVRLQSNPLGREIVIFSSQERRLTPLAQRLLPALRRAFTG